MSNVLTIFDFPIDRLSPGQTHQCIVCMADQSADQFEERHSEECQHSERRVCNTCVFTSTKAALQYTSDSEVKCPEPGCQAQFSYNDVKQIFLKNNDKALFDLYDHRLKCRCLEQMPEFSWCPCTGCDSGQLNEKINTSDQSRVTCHNCKQSVCSSHQTEWHTGMTCDEYDRSKENVDRQTKEWLDKNSKQCPICKSAIEKNRGCDQMICRKCRHQFCWECLADHHLIHTQGLYYHEPTCSHYPRQQVTSHQNRSRLDISTMF